MFERVFGNQKPRGLGASVGLLFQTSFSQAAMESEQPGSTTTGPADVSLALLLFVTRPWC